MRSINLIVIHCAATPNGVFVTPAQIDAWHAQRGFARRPEDVALFNRPLPHIGYHFVVGTDGRVYTGRSTEEIGAHAAGHNEHSVGICMVGTDRFFMTQWLALSDLLRQLAAVWQSDRLPRDQRVPYPLSAPLAIQQFSRMGIQVMGHRDLSPDKNGDGKITSIDWLKTCPGFDVASWLGADMIPKSSEMIIDGDPSIAHHLPNVRTGVIA